MLDAAEVQVSSTACGGRATRPAMLLRGTPHYFAGAMPTKLRVRVRRAERVAPRPGHPAVGPHIISSAVATTTEVIPTNPHRDPAVVAINLKLAQSAAQIIDWFRVFRRGPGLRWRLRRTLRLDTSKSGAGECRQSRINFPRHVDS